MEQSTQTPPEPNDPKTQTPVSPLPAPPPQTPVAPQTNVLSAAERKRKLATKLGVIGAICLTAPVWGVFIFMATSDSAGSSSGAEAILPTIIGSAIGLAPVPGIGLLIASLVVRNQAKKLEAASAPGSSSAAPERPASPTDKL